jgi:hypothetical protein
MADEFRDKPFAHGAMAAPGAPQPTIETGQ